jgi:hypothetical protein
MNSQDFRNLQEAYLNVYEQEEALDEKVLGQDPESREAGVEERKSGNKRLPPSSGKGYADNQKKSISYMNKLTKNNKIIPGMAHEEVEEFDEATAMAKRGKDETEIRNTIAKKTGASGAGKFADKATALANRQTYGDNKKKEGREKLARTQRGDFRDTTSSSPGLRGYGHKSSDPAVKAKQDARGNQRARAALTPNERKQNNMESYDLFDYMMEYLIDEGYADTNENALVIMANMSEEWRENILTEVSQDEFRAGMMKAAAKMPSDVRTPSREELFGSKEERSKIKLPKGVVNPTPDTSANIRKSSEYSSPRASRGLPAAGYN